MLSWQSFLLLWWLLEELTWLNIKLFSWLRFITGKHKGQEQQGKNRHRWRLERTLKEFLVLLHGLHKNILYLQLWTTRTHKRSSCRELLQRWLVINLRIASQVWTPNLAPGVLHKPSCSLSTCPQTLSSWPTASLCAEQYHYPGTTWTFPQFASPSLIRGHHQGYRKKWKRNETDLLH